MARAKAIPASNGVQSVADEFRKAELGDRRRTKRLRTIVDAFSAAPDRSLPEMARDEAELEGIYRFLNNEAFSFEAMLLPHVTETAHRAASEREILIAHDVSECSFPLDDCLREGYVKLGTNHQGFRLHASLALSTADWKRPLGLLNASVWTDSAKGSLGAEHWLRFANAAALPVRGRTRVVHIMDREGAALELFHGIAMTGDAFVIRLTRQRRVELDGVSLRVADAAQQLDGIHELEVPLSRRRPHFVSDQHAPRRARRARLTYAAASIIIRRPWMRDPGALPLRLPINFVCARELAPPPGEEPVDWLLATNLPIGSVSEVIRVVDTYKARWRIEEFFKALKTGCALEKRQLETLDATKKLLAISLVVAWRILLLRDESRISPDQPTTSLSPLETAVLRKTGRRRLSTRPTARETLLAVAALGGHIKNNGDPGWLVIGRGMERLLERTYAIIALSRLDRCEIESLKELARAEM